VKLVSVWYKGKGIKDCLEAEASLINHVSCFVFVKAEHLIAEFVSKHMCLEAGPLGDTLRLNPCETGNAFQKWQFTHYHA